MPTTTGMKGGRFSTIFRPTISIIYLRIFSLRGKQPSQAITSFPVRLAGQLSVVLFLLEPCK